MDYRVLLLLSAAITILIVLGGLLFEYLERIPEDASIFTFDLPIEQEEFNQSIGVFSQYGIGTNVESISISALLALNTFDKFNRWEMNVTIGQTNDSHYILSASILRQPINPWSFYNSLFFAESLATTIGFGNIAPKTTEGRLCACAYAVFTIPIVGVWMGGIGEAILAAAKRIRNRVAKSRQRRRVVLILEAAFIFVFGSGLFIFLPSWLFAAFEDWSYLDGFYFSVLTLLVVGLGDIVAGTNDAKSPGWYRVIINFWLLFGLGWLSMIVSLVLELIKTRASRVAATVERAAVFTEKMLAKKLLRRKAKKVGATTENAPQITLATVNASFVGDDDDDDDEVETGPDNTIEELPHLLRHNDSLVIPVDVRIFRPSLTGSPTSGASLCGSTLVISNSRRTSVASQVINTHHLSTVDEALPSAPHRASIEFHTLRHRSAKSSQSSLATRDGHIHQGNLVFRTGSNWQRQQTVHLTPKRLATEPAFIHNQNNSTSRLDDSGAAAGEYILMNDLGIAEHINVNNNDRTIVFVRQNSSRF